MKILMKTAMEALMMKTQQQTTLHSLLGFWMQMVMGMEQKKLRSEVAINLLDMPIYLQIVMIAVQMQIQMQMKFAVMKLIMTVMD